MPPPDEGTAESEPRRIRASRVKATTFPAAATRRTPRALRTSTTPKQLAREAAPGQRCREARNDRGGAQGQGPGKRQEARRPLDHPPAAAGSRDRRRQAEGRSWRATKKNMWVAAIVGALLAAFVTIIALNFVGGEKRVERKLEHRACHRRPAVSARARVPCSARRSWPAIASSTSRMGSRSSPRCSTPSGRQGGPSTSKPTFTGPGRSGASSSTALAERARAGVEVQVLIDWVGSQKMDEPLS